MLHRSAMGKQLRSGRILADIIGGKNVKFGRFMKVLGLVLSALLLVAAPAIAVEYQGKNIDGRKFAAKAYYYKTGGVYDVQVQFKQNRATIYFASGEQVNIRLRGRVINDPSRVEGYGRPGQISLGGIFSAGLNYNNLGGAGLGSDNLGNYQSPGPYSLGDFWIISLDLKEITPASAKSNSKFG